MDSKQKNFIISALRRSTFSWKPRGAAKKKARVPNGKYKNGKTKYGYLCNICKNIFMDKETVMDHVEPVMKTDDETTWVERVERMIPYEDGWQCICKDCHDVKTKRENEERKQYRHSKKK